MEEPSQGAVPRIPQKYFRYIQSVPLMVAVGLLLRLMVVAFVYRDHLNPILDHWKFGWEMGEVARSLYLGKGFASPMFQPSGPTAWLTPVYPMLIALCFKLFGLHTAGAAWAICGINALAGAATAACVFFAARRSFGDGVALLAGWMWTLLPYSVYVAGARIWENSLTAFIMSAIFLQTLRVEERPGAGRWLGWGALWGVGALSSPALLATLPPLGLWVAYRLQRRGAKWLVGAVASAVVFWAVLAPWVIRNYEVFGKFIPLRDNFWLEVHVGNNGRTFEPTPPDSHPSNSARELAQWNALGELQYMEAKKVEAKAFIREHPGFVAWMTLRRFVYTWTAFWALTPEYLEEEPSSPPNIVLTTAMTLAFLAAFRIAKRKGQGASMTPYKLALFFFPLVYYITHPQMDYRHPIDVMIVILTSYTIHHWWTSREKARSERASAEMAMLHAAGTASRVEQS